MFCFPCVLLGCVDVFVYARCDIKKKIHFFQFGVDVLGVLQRIHIAA